MSLREPSVQIQNIVATASFNVEIDMYTLERKVENIEYDPNRFPGLIYRLEEPRATVLIFRSGRAVIAGTKSVNDVIRAVKKLIRAFKQINIEIKETPKVQVQNIVATANFHGIIHLEKASYLLENTMYEPEQFPGLVYRMEKPRAVILFFVSGKAVIAGVRREEDVYKATKNAYEILVQNGCIIPHEETEEELL